MLCVYLLLIPLGSVSQLSRDLPHCSIHAAETVSKLVTAPRFCYSKAMALVEPLASDINLIGPVTQSDLSFRDFHLSSGAALLDLCPLDESSTKNKVD